MRIDKKNTDNKTDKAVRRNKELRCGICRPNRGKNAKRRPKHGVKKPKKK